MSKKDYATVRPLAGKETRTVVRKREEERVEQQTERGRQVHTRPRRMRRGKGGTLLLRRQGATRRRIQDNSREGAYPCSHEQDSVLGQVICGSESERAMGAHKRHETKRGRERDNEISNLEQSKRQPEEELDSVERERGRETERERQKERERERERDRERERGRQKRRGEGEEVLYTSETEYERAKRRESRETGNRYKTGRGLRGRETDARVE